MCNKYKLETNLEKKLLITLEKLAVKINGKEIKEVNKFVYFGSVVKVTRK